MKLLDAQQKTTAATHLLQLTQWWATGVEDSDDSKETKLQK
jgi:hypothetical protein